MINLTVQYNAKDKIHYQRLWLFASATSFARRNKFRLVGTQFDLDLLAVVQLALATCKPRTVLNFRRSRVVVAVVVVVAAAAVAVGLM